MTSSPFHRLAYQVTLGVSLLLAAAPSAPAEALPGVHNADTNLELVREQTSESEARIVIVFTQGQKNPVVVKLTPEQEQRLTANPKSYGRDNLKGEIVSITLRKATVAFRTSSGASGEGDGYVITCRVKLTPQGKAERSRFVVNLPGVPEVTGECQASLNGSFSGGSLIWDATVYPSEEALAEKKRTEAEGRARHQAS